MLYQFLVVLLWTAFSNVEGQIKFSVEPGTATPMITEHVNATEPANGTHDGMTTVMPTADPPMPTPGPNATKTELFLYRMCSVVGNMTDLITYGYDYRYDGDHGYYYYDYYGTDDNPTFQTGYGDRRIHDGGRDMYDTGNEVSFITNGTNETHIIYGQHYLREDLDFLSKPRHPFIAAMWIGNEESTTESFSIRVVGDTGADGGGDTGTFSGSFSASGYDVTFYVMEVYNAYDPTICELYFTLSNTEKWGSYLTHDSVYLDIERETTHYLNNTATVAGYPRNVALFYVLLSRTYGVVIEPHEVISVINRYVSAIALEEVVFPNLNLTVMTVPKSISAFVGTRVRLCENTRYDDHRYTRCERGQVATLSSLEKSVSTVLGYDVIVEAEIMECVEPDMCNATCDRHLTDATINCSLVTCCSYNYCNYPHYWWYYYPWNKNTTSCSYMLPEESLPTTPIEILPHCFVSDLVPEIVSCLRPFQNAWPYNGEDPSLCSATLADSLRCIARVLGPAHTDDIFNLALTRLPIQNVTAFAESLILDGSLSALMCSSGEVDFVEAFLGNMSFFQWLMYSVPSRMYPLFGECDILMSHSMLDWTTDLINTVRNGENRTQLCKSAKRFLHNIHDARTNRCNFTAFLDYLPCDSVLHNQLRALYVQAPERMMDFIPDFCAGIEPDPIIDEVIRDADFLPSCTFRQAVESVWTCEGIFTESAPYSIPDACKNNVNRLLQCVANRIEDCAKGDGFNVFSLIERGEQYFENIIQTIRSMAIGETSWWYYDVRDIFCTNSHIYYFNEWDETFGVMGAICDARTWPDLMDQVQDLYFKYAGARNSADLCMAFRGIRDWIANTTRDRCHNIDLIKYLYPSESEFGEMVVKYAKVLEYMLPKARISICPDTMMPMPGKLNATAWIRSYVKWRIDTLPKWLAAYERWRDEMKMDPADLPEAPSCLDLTRLRCKSSTSTCALDDRRCMICFCPNEDYVDLGDYAFEPWLMDFDNWQIFFESYNAAFDAWERTT